MHSLALSLPGLSSNERILGMRTVEILCRRDTTPELAAGLAVLRVSEGDVRVNRGCNLVCVELGVRITVGELCRSELIPVKDGRPRPPETFVITEVLLRIILLPASAVLDWVPVYGWRAKRPDGVLTEPKDPGKVGLPCPSRELFGYPKGAVDIETPSDRIIVVCVRIDLKGFGGRA